MNQRSNDQGKPTREGVKAARTRISGVATGTPLLPVGQGRGRIWIKAESLQLGGAFKLRGAYNRLSLMRAEQRPAGVVAFSSGNHAQGVARAARMLGMPALIVMPADAPEVKVAATRALGAKIVSYDRARESREAIAARIAEERGAVLVPSFDDIDVIEGQGTAGLEIAEQLGRVPARVVIPCGGGGLAAGIALALPDAAIVTAEPEGWDDMARSLESGVIVEVAADTRPSACDALLTRRVSELTFGALRDAGASGVWASDAEVSAAMRFAFAMGLVVEPGGAIALAAWLAGKLPEMEGDTVIVCSGSNVDPVAFAAILREEA